MTTDKSLPTPESLGNYFKIMAEKLNHNCSERVPSLLQLVELVIDKHNFLAESHNKLKARVEEIDARTKKKTESGSTARKGKKNN